ncbi:MAG: hypothetical protein WCP98_05370 [Actinomycetes bacterium]
MKRMIFILAVATLVLTLATGAAFAGKGPKTPPPPPPTKCPETLVTDWPGVITADLGHNEYTFVPTDTQYGASFVLDCGPDWYKVVTLAMGAATVTGEIETSKKGILEIGVHSVTDSAGATTVVKGEGKPPWAGGPGGHGQPDDDCDD